MLKNNSFLWLLFTFAFTHSFVYSQEVFRVLAKKGTVQIENKGATTVAKPGEKVFADSKIIITEGGYLSLVHSTSRRNVELLKPGTFKAKDLSASVSTVKLSTSQRFADFVVNEVGKSSNESYQDNMKLAGSVSRSSNKQKTAQELLKDKVAEEREKTILKDVSVEDWLFTNKDVNLTPYFTFGMVAYPTKGIFKWTRGSGEKTKFTVNIWDVDKVVLLYAEETEDTTLTINLAEAGVSEKCFWSIESKNPSFETEKYELLVLTETQVKEIEKEGDDILKELGETNNPFAKLVMARFAEENLLLPQAELLYKQVMEENPLVPEYKGLYCKFLLRNGNSILAKPYL